MKNSNKILLIALAVVFLGCGFSYGHKGGSNFATNLFSGSVAFASAKTETTDGSSESKSYEVGNFDALQLRSAANVKIISGTKPRVDVSGDKKYVSLLQVFVEGVSLHVELAENLHLSFTEKPEITIVTASSIKDISLVGFNNVEANNFISHSLNIDVTGSNRCNFSGKVDELKINTTGSNQIDTKKLIASDVDINSTGFSLINVYANHSLEINAMGSSQINYLGHPQKVSKSVLGFSRVEEGGV